MYHTFHIILDKPDPPSNCSLYNKSSSRVVVECLPGFDGGLSQLFHIEVYKTTGKLPIHNETSDVPNFLLNTLPSQSTLLFEIYSSNSKGKSPRVSLQTDGLEVSEIKSGNVSNTQTVMVNQFKAMIKNVYIFVSIPFNKK